MNLKNKYYEYFQLFCDDLGLPEEKALGYIKKMNPKDKLFHNDLMLQIESIKEWQNEKVYTLKLFDADKKCLRNGPTILTKPKKHRRAISPIIATILLVGISVAGIAVILPLMTSSTDTLNQSTACYLLNVKLYDITTTSQAYFIVNLENLGSTDVTDAQITFFDDLDAEYGFYENSLELYPESSLMRNQTFAASITTDNTYLVNATITANDGSRASCIQSITAR